MPLCSKLPFSLLLACPSFHSEFPLCNRTPFYTPTDVLFSRRRHPREREERASKKRDTRCVRSAAPPKNIFEGKKIKFRAKFSKTGGCERGAGAEVGFPGGLPLGRRDCHYMGIADSGRGEKNGKKRRSFPKKVITKKWKERKKRLASRIENGLYVVEYSRKTPEDHL